MKLLALDTTTEACSAALLIDGNIDERYEIAPQRHTELILVMIDSLCANAQLTLSQLDGLAFARGPGSFTGLRIGSSVVQALAFAADLPVVPISSLAALAQSALEQTGLSQVLAAIDARMREVYWGSFCVDHAEEGLWIKAASAEALGVPAAVKTDRGDGPWVGCGSGWDTYESELRESLGGNVIQVLTNQFPRASVVARLGVKGLENGLSVGAEHAQPVYLRNNVVKV